MIYALMDGEKRQPRAKGERSRCDGCGAELRAVLPTQNIWHWRHKGGDCDSWSEKEGEWHLWWKEQFPLHCREVSLRDNLTGELHRADILGPGTSGRGVVLELQQSPISEEERIARESFYMQERQLFWLLNMHDPATNRAFSFGISLQFNKPVNHKDRIFYTMHWLGQSKAFIEKWKSSVAHVFLDYDGKLYYLATNAACGDLVRRQATGQFAIACVTFDEFVAAVSPMRS